MGVPGIFNFFARPLLYLVIILGAVLVIPNLPPYTEYSKSYKVIAPELKGQFALNDRLNDVELWHKGDFVGPEAFDDYNGELYASIHGGEIVKFVGNMVKPVVKMGQSCKGDLDEEVCGRPLGLSFDSNGLLYVADGFQGIFRVDVKTGKKEKIISLDKEIDGKKPKFPNCVVVASNGDLFWTDTSSEFSQPDALFEMLSDGTGRLIHYNAKTRQNKVLIKNLVLANGVALPRDEEFVIVSDEGRNRVLRYYLKGSKKGHHDIFLDSLPGMPDNIKSDGRDGFLIALMVPVDAENPNILQWLGQYPLARKLISRMMALSQLAFSYLDQIYPNHFCKQAVHYIGNFKSVSGLIPVDRATVLHVSRDGKILDTVSATNGKISGISEAHIFEDMLYLGSPFNDFIGRIHLKKIGWSHLVKVTRKIKLEGLKKM